MMQKSFATIGEVAAPIVFMVFIGYHIGKHTNTMAISIIGCAVIGFMVAVFNVWKLMRKLSHQKDE